MWDAIREFLGAVVSFFYGLVPNLGVAIILLTVAVGLLMFPLTLKQTRSMRAMQLLQPELKRLQKEYVGDKPGLQQATLALYKERGVNPAAGCLPMLLQMPIWFALYQVLQSFSATPLSLHDTCAGQEPGIAPGGAYACSFEGYVAGGADGRLNTVTARLRDAGSREENRVDTASVGVGGTMSLVTVALQPGSAGRPPGRGPGPVHGGGRQRRRRRSDPGRPLRRLLRGSAGPGERGDRREHLRHRPARPCRPEGRFPVPSRATVPGGTSAHQSTLTAVLRDGAGVEASRSDTAAVGVGEVMPLVTVSVRPESGVVPGGWRPRPFHGRGGQRGDGGGHPGGLGGRPVREPVVSGRRPHALPHDGAKRQAAQRHSGMAGGGPPAREPGVAQLRLDELEHHAAQRLRPRVRVLHPLPAHPAAGHGHRLLAAEADHTQGQGRADAPSSPARPS